MAAMALIVDVEDHGGCRSTQLPSLQTALKRRQENGRNQQMPLGSVGNQQKLKYDVNNLSMLESLPGRLQHGWCSNLSFVSWSGAPTVQIYIKVIKRDFVIDTPHAPLQIKMRVVAALLIAREVFRLLGICSTCMGPSATRWLGHKPRDVQLITKITLWLTLNTPKDSQVAKSWTKLKMESLRLHHRYTVHLHPDCLGFGLRIRSLAEANQPIKLCCVSSFKQTSWKEIKATWWPRYCFYLWGQVLAGVSQKVVDCKTKWVVDVRNSSLIAIR